jgi:hypothetical protein
MKCLSLIVALATTVASSSVFGTVSQNTSYELTGSGFSGTITLDAPSGTYNNNPTVEPAFLAFPAVITSPIVSYDFVADGVTFNSASGNDSISGNTSITWTPTAITSITLGVVDSDPWSADFSGGDLYIYNDTGGLGDLGNASPDSGPITLPVVPEPSVTWLLLAGGCAVFGTRQFLNRPGMKLSRVKMGHRS